ncbi:MAG: hypothetical protein KDN05_02150 [Verrucomicrobiae bacterium]|nr:hypothetical protein [Verrucomicrobiae bacterium]MCP5546843.1 hypothetical protein [Akkermansiaceae bacterium]
MKDPEMRPTVDDRVRGLAERAGAEVRGECRRCIEYARESPGKAMLAAGAAGYVLHWLPLRALLVAKLRLTMKLLPPALFVYGAAKACEMARLCAQNAKRGDGGNQEAALGFTNPHSPS